MFPTILNIIPKRKRFNQIQAWIMRTFFYTGYLFSVKVHFAPMHLNKPKCCLCFILCGRWLVFVSTEFVSLAFHLANMICIWEINKKFHAFSLVSISEFDIFSNDMNNILFILLKDQQINQCIVVLRSTSHFRCIII